MRRMGFYAALAALLLATTASGREPDGRPTVGLALSGGAARGFAHIGVIRWLEENRIPVDHIAGTSMGGLVGDLYAMGYSPDEMQALVGSIDWPAFREALRDIGYEGVFSLEVHCQVQRMPPELIDDAVRLVHRVGRFLA